MSEKTESDDMKSQETQLRSKYGNIEKRSGQHLLMKQLAGKKQYFDSGDYNMQLRKGKTTKTPLAAIPNKGKKYVKKLSSPILIRLFSAAAKGRAVAHAAQCRQDLATAEANDETAQVNGQCTKLRIKSPFLTLSSSMFA